MCKLSGSWVAVHWRDWLSVLRGRTTQAKPCHAMTPRTPSGAAMEVNCARASSTHSGCDTKESGSQQSENIVLNMCMPYCSYFLASNVTSLFLFCLTHNTASTHCNCLFLPGKYIIIVVLNYKHWSSVFMFTTHCSSRTASNGRNNKRPIFSWNWLFNGALLGKKAQ